MEYIFHAQKRVDYGLQKKQNKEDEKELPAFCEGESFESFPVKITEHDTLPKQRR